MGWMRRRKPSERLFHSWSKMYDLKYLSNFTGYNQREWPLNYDISSQCKIVGQRLRSWLIALYHWYMDLSYSTSIQAVQSRKIGWLLLCRDRIRLLWPNRCVLCAWEWAGRLVSAFRYLYSIVGSNTGGSEICYVTRGGRQKCQCGWNSLIVRATKKIQLALSYFDKYEWDTLFSRSPHFDDMPIRYTHPLDKIVGTCGITTVSSLLFLISSIS